MKIFLCLCVVAFAASACWAFNEEAIFEDEDIYAQALPPEPHKTSLTAPGTKWCGPGSSAANYNELGTQIETDKCCRDHDHCEHIKAGASMHGMTNDDWFPIMQCNCEQKFLNCLQTVNTTIAKTLGRVYFGTRSKCYDFGYPIQNCKSYQITTFMRRCIVYNVNASKPKKWQLYDTPLFSVAKK